MGKIFQISKNPVSTITSCLEPLEIPRPTEQIIKSPTKTKLNKLNRDKFESKKITNTSNPFIKMRNGIGKLMSHFQYPTKEV